MSRLKLVGKAMMLINGAFNGLDQTLGQFGSYEVLSIVAKLGDAAGYSAGESMGGGVFGKQASGEHVVGAAGIEGEFGRAEIYRTVELQMRSSKSWLSQSQWHTSARRASATLLCGWLGAGRFSEASRARHVGIRASVLVFSRLVCCRRRPISWLRIASSWPGAVKHDEGVFPVMTGRLDDEEERRWAECHQPGVVALAVLSDDDGLAGRSLCIIQTEHDVTFRRNSDRSEADLLNCNTQGLEAWAPAPTLFVAKARTQAGKAAPQDTLRAQKAGRAHQSYACGITRKQSAAILSRLPSRNPSQDSC